MDPIEILKDQNFVQWLFYALAAWKLWDWIKAKIQPAKASPVRVVGGTISVEDATRVATLVDIQAIDDKIDELREEMQGQHLESKRSGEARVAAITTAMEGERDETRSALHDLTMKVEMHTTALHEKVNEVVASVALHKGQMPLVLQRLTEINNAFSQVQTRIDDAIRLNKR